jgi:hypothetical protein
MTLSAQNRAARDVLMARIDARLEAAQSATESGKLRIAAEFDLFRGSARGVEPMVPERILLTPDD